MPTNLQHIESCPKCGSTDAWHTTDRLACDECGFWMTVVVKPAPKPRRPFTFSVEVVDGAVFVDWRGAALVSFKPGWYLSLGGLNIISAREEERLQQLWTSVGREVGRDEAVAS